MPTAGSWKPGASGNPRGRPIGSRQAIADSLIPDVAHKWREHGNEVLDRLIAEEPKAFAQLAASLCPKEVSLSVEQKLPAGLSQEDYANLTWILKIVAQHTPPGAPAGTVLPVVADAIEQALRSEFARTIEHQASAPSDLSGTLEPVAPCGAAMVPKPPF